MQTARDLNARNALTAAVVAVRAQRLNVTHMDVNGGELIVRVHRHANGRVARASYTYQGKRIERALALRLATQPRTKFRH